MRTRRIEQSGIGLPVGAHGRLVGVLAAALLGGCAAGPHMNEPGPHAPACPAIQAAADLEFPSDRDDILGALAASPALGEHEQMFLVDAALGMWGSGTESATALVALVRNPAATPGALAYITERIRGRGMFTSDRERIADAMAERALRDPPGP